MRNRKNAISLYGKAALTTTLLMGMVPFANASAVGTPLGPEFAANPANPDGPTITYNPGIARAADGSFVSFWYAEEGTVGCFGQRFNADGSPNGTPFLVTTTSAAFSCQIAMNAAGNFVATWFSSDLTGGQYHLYAQLYSAAAVPQGSVIDVAAMPKSVLGDSFLTQAAAMDSSGGFAVAWRYLSSIRLTKTVPPLMYNAAYLYGRVYQSNGTAASAAFRVHSDPAKIGLGPVSGPLDVQLAVAPNGDVLFCWDELGSLVDVQRFSHSGIAKGAVFDATAGDGLSANSKGVNTIPQIAMQPSGGYVVAWQTGLQSPAGANAIAARLFSVSDTATGNAITVANIPPTSLPPDGVQLATDSAGDFAVAWAQPVLSGSNYQYSLEGQLYNAGGSPVGNSFKLDSNDAMTQTPLRIGVDGNGNLAATWVGFDASYNSFAMVRLFTGP